VFFGGYSAQGGPTLRQMVSLGVQAKLLGGDGICATETHRLSGGVADGTVLCAQAGTILGKADAGPPPLACLKVFCGIGVLRFAKPLGRRPVEPVIGRGRNQETAPRASRIWCNVLRRAQ
jgi:hypothetical protein